MADGEAQDDALSQVLGSSFGAEGPCAMFPEEPHKCLILHRIKFSVSLLSFLASLFMIFIIWLFRKYEVFRQRLILYLSISSALTSLTYLFATTPETTAETKCSIDGFLATYCDWSVLLWILNITINLTYQVSLLANRRTQGGITGASSTRLGAKPQKIKKINKKNFFFFFLAGPKAPSPVKKITPRCSCS